MHSRQHLPRLVNVALEEPEEALEVDHRTDPLVLHALFHAADVTRPPQAVSNQVGDTRTNCGAGARLKDAIQIS